MHGFTGTKSPKIGRIAKDGFYRGNFSSEHGRVKGRFFPPQMGRILVLDLVGDVLSLILILIMHVHRYFNLPEF